MLSLCIVSRMLYQTISESIEMCTGSTVSAYYLVEIINVCVSKLSCGNDAVAYACLAFSCPRHYFIEETMLTRVLE